MAKAFLSDSDHPEPTSLTDQEREWPEQGIRIPEDEQEALELCGQLNECFKKLKKQIESVTPPGSPGNGPERSETNASSKATNSGMPFCQGVLFDKRLHPRKSEHDGKDKYVEDEEWKKLRGLGEGLTGVNVVSEAQDITTEFKCAVKQIPFKKYEPFEGFAWAQMDHQNIPKLYGIVREKPAEAANTSDAGKVFLFCEEINNHKPFLDFIEEDCKEWPSFLVKEFINTVEEQVGSAVAHIHSKGLAHNDLVSDNIVIEDFDADKGSDRKAWVIDFGSTAPAKKYRASRNAPAIEYDKNRDKAFIKELFARAREILEEMEDAEEELKRSKEEKEKELLEQIDAGMKDLELEGAAGAATNTLPEAGPPKSDYSMDDGGDRVKGSRFKWVKIDGASSTASISTSKTDDISEDDTQDKDQPTTAAPNKILLKDPPNMVQPDIPQIPSNVNVRTEDTKPQPLSEIQPSRIENQ